jgi:7-keto-8-aminopelargonate synthetase-like enzyme
MALPPYLQTDTSSTSLALSSLSTSLATDPSTLPTPIVPILTRYPRPLAQHLRERGFLARPITHPTVPKGEERVRVSADSILIAPVIWLSGSTPRSLIRVELTER